MPVLYGHMCSFFLLIKREEGQQNKILNESLHDEYNNNQQHFQLKLTEGSVYCSKKIA